MIAARHLTAFIAAGSLLTVAGLAQGQSATPSQADFDRCNQVAKAAVSGSNPSASPGSSASGTPSASSPAPAPPSVGSSTSGGGTPSGSTGSGSGSTSSMGKSSS